MDNDVTSYRMAIGLFYCRSCSVSKKFLFKSLRLLPYFVLLLIALLQKIIQTLPSLLKVIFRDPFKQNLSFTLFLLQLLLLSNDVAENPGPDKKVSDLTVFHWNARSVRNKIEYLETICLGSSIVCITESHLDDKVSTQDILISGYLEPFRNDRNCFGGGVLIYIADYLHASRRYDL